MIKTTFSKLTKLLKKSYSILSENLFFINNFLKVSSVYQDTLFVRNEKTLKTTSENPVNATLLNKTKNNFPCMCFQFSLVQCVFTFTNIYVINLSNTMHKNTNVYMGLQQRKFLPVTLFSSILSCQQHSKSSEFESDLSGSEHP